MTDKKPHPEDCRCERCKAHRHQDMMRDSYPEEERRQRHIKGQDSEPLEPRIPDGMTERDARQAGLI